MGSLGDALGHASRAGRHRGIGNGECGWRTKTHGVATQMASLLVHPVMFQLTDGSPQQLPLCPHTVGYHTTDWPTGQVKLPVWVVVNSASEYPFPVVGLPEQPI